MVCVFTDLLHGPNSLHTWLVQLVRENRRSWAPDGVESLPGGLRAFVPEAVNKRTWKEVMLFLH